MLVDRIFSEDATRTPASRFLGQALAKTNPKTRPVARLVQSD